MGNVSNSQLSIPRNNKDSLTDGFINAFKPSTSGVDIIGRYIDVGIVWSTATTESQISWLNRFYIEDMSVDYDEITFSLIDPRELDFVMLPPFTIQKDSDDGISYYPDAPNDAVGKVIPIVYGKFSTNYDTNELGYGSFEERSPCIVVNSTTAKAIISCHVCEEIRISTVPYLWRYISGVDCYLRMTNSVAGSNAYENSAYHSSISIMNDTDAIIGRLVIPLRQVGQGSEVTDFPETINGNPSEYYSLAENTVIGLGIEGSVSTEEIGYLGYTAGDSRVWFRVESYNGSTSIGYELRDYDYSTNPATAGGGGATSGSVTSVTYINRIIGNWDGSPTEASALNRFEIQLKNTEVTAGRELKIYYGWIEMNNINVLGFKSVPLFKSFEQWKFAMQQNKLPEY